MKEKIKIKNSKPFSKTLSFRSVSLRFRFSFRFPPPRFSDDRQKAGTSPNFRKNSTIFGVVVANALEDEKPTTVGFSKNGDDGFEKEGGFESVIVGKRFSGVKTTDGDDERVGDAGFAFFQLRNHGLRFILKERNFF